MSKERYPYSGGRKEIRLSKGIRKHIRLIKQGGDDTGRALEFREKEVEKKRAQQRRELQELEKRLKEESDSYKIAEMKFKTPWLKEKLGDITEDERKKDVKKIITGLEPDIFKKFVMEENGNGKTKVREIIDEISPREKFLNELEELEIKQMGEKYLPPEEALTIKFTHIWLEVKLGKLMKDEERFKRIINLYESYPADITEVFKRDKAQKIIKSLFPREEPNPGGIKRCKVANRKD